MRQIVIRKGDKCLSGKHTNNGTHLDQECNNGHGWSSTPRTVKNLKWWCYCAKNVKHTLKMMQDLAIQKNVKYLSKKYINLKTKLDQECEKDHRWSAYAGNILKGHCCPMCADKVILFFIYGTGWRNPRAVCIDDVDCRFSWSVLWSYEQANSVSANEDACAMELRNKV